MTICAIRGALSTFVALLAWSGTGIAQQSKAPRPAAIQVVIETIAEGERVARRPDQVLEPGQKEPSPFRMVGRRIAWRIGDERFPERAAMQQVFARLVAGAGDRDQEPPVILVPDDKARWDDVVLTIDDAYEAGIWDVSLADIASFPVALLAKSVTYPVREQGAIVVSQAVYQEPDEDEPDYWRPQIVVRQDGRTQYRDRTLFDSSRADASSELLRTELKRIGERAEKEHGRRDAKGQLPERLAGRLMVCADKWATWADVRRVLQLATRLETPFWMFDYAVTDSHRTCDFEARLAKGERF